MAKKKTETVASPSPSAADDRVMIAQFKGPAEFRDWVIELADHERSSVVHLIEMALLDRAAKAGFVKPAPKRKGIR